MKIFNSIAKRPVTGLFDHKYGWFVLCKGRAASVTFGQTAGNPSCLLVLLKFRSRLFARQIAQLNPCKLFSPLLYNLLLLNGCHHH